MKEVIRLVRLTLILRIIVSLFSACVALTLLPTATPVLFDLVAIVPSLLLLAVAVIAPFRHESSEHFVKGLLVAMIVAETFEAVISRLGYQWLFTASGIDPGDFYRRIPGLSAEWAIMRLPLNVPLLFISIPALLGAWIGGRRSAPRWAAFTVLMSLLSTISTTNPEFAQWRLNIGVFGAQAMVVVITCYFVASLADQQRDEQKQLEAANRALAAQALVREQLATARERVRLARDLHDTLAHTLAGLAVQAKVVDTLFDKDPTASRRELARMQSVTRQGLADARAAIGDLRTNIVEDIGLGNALQRQVESLQLRSNMQATFERSGEEPQIDQTHAETLYRIVQEALNNVERHARANRVIVSMQQAPLSDDPYEAVSFLTIVVKDDGVGFDTASLDDERFGVRGMRERAELIGAHLRIDSIIGSGTTVTITLRLPV